MSLVPQFSAAAVRRLHTVPESVTAAAAALRSLSDGSGVMPVRSVVKLPIEPKVGFLINKPAMMGKYCVTKTLTVFPGNTEATSTSATGCPAIQGFVQLFSAENGRPLCIAEAGEVTLLRTAAASAVATQALARDPEGGSVLALLGTGPQCLAHFHAISHVRHTKKVYVWGRNPERAEGAAEEIRGAIKQTGTKIEVAVSPTVKEAASEADIICTLTAAGTPILEGAWLRAGTHINAVGAYTPAHRELDTEVVKRSKVYCDTLAACLEEPGDLVHPLKEGSIEASHIIGEIGEVLNGKLAGRQEGDQESITLFKSVGIALEDLTATAALFEKSQLEVEGDVESSA